MGPLRLFFLMSKSKYKTKVECQSELTRSIFSSLMNNITRSIDQLETRRTSATGHFEGEVNINKLRHTFEWQIDNTFPNRTTRLIRLSLTSSLSNNEQHFSIDVKQIQTEKSDQQIHNDFFDGKKKLCGRLGRFYFWNDRRSWEEKVEPWIKRFDYAYF